jgi:fumarate reductase flavoprotein subunit
MTKTIALLMTMLFGLIGTAASAQTLLDIHGKAGVPCAACHQETPAAAAPPDATCVACHGTMVEGPVPLTPDPHHSPHLGVGETPVCSDCHKVHRPSEVTCNLCHKGFNFETP